MHIRPRKTSALIVAAAAALTLTACDPPAETAAEESPLNAYLMSIYGMDGDEQEMEERFAEQNRKTEELVAQCMNEAGFEYVPVDTTAMTTITTADEWEPDDEDWVAKYGYGIHNFPGKEEAENAVTFEDPNSTYLEQLSETEQNAYFETLYGPQEPMDGEGGGVIFDGSDASDRGCYGAASEEVSGGDPLQSDEFAPLMEELNTFWAKSAEAPEFAEIDAEWADCMAAENEPGFRSRPEAEQSIYDEMNAFYETVGDVEPDESELKELQKREVKLALVDLQCRNEVDYTGKAAKAQAKLEKRFMADHKAELDALKAAVEQGRK